MIRAQATQAPDVVLALEGITKRFGASIVLQAVDFRVRGGSVHALLGENGAGKTTLMRIAFGMLAPDAGRLVVRGKNRTVHAPADALAQKIGMVHQHFTNVPSMSVAENVALGHRGAYNARLAADRVRTIGRATGLVLDPDARVERLNVGAQQRLEIVKALGNGATLLILDEPTAVLAPEETDDLLRWIRGYADAGNAVVLITHKLREALATADDITVLRRGAVALSGGANAMTVEDLTRAMLGESLGIPATSPRTPPARPETVAQATELYVRDERGTTAVRGLSLDLHAGEILGIAAVEGAGQRQLLRVLAGRLASESGSLTLPHRIAFIPEDRHADALVLESPAYENVALRGAGARRGLVPWRDIRQHTRELAAAFDVRGATEHGAVRSLSGGNQQKLVLARELDGDPELVVAENPSRGLDVRASRAVFDRLRDAAARGAAVIVYSSDLDEVLSIADRIAVMHAGSLTRVGHDRDAVGRAMLGLA